MRVECVELAPGKVRLVVTGHLGLPTAAEFRERLAHELTLAGTVLVDLAGVSEIDVTALQVLVAAGKTAKAAGKEVEIVDGLPALVRRVWLGAGLPGASLAGSANPT